MKRKRIAFIFISVILIFGGMVQTAAAQGSSSGHFEFNAHYGRWSLNILKSVIEDKLNEIVEDELKKRILEKVHEDHPGYMEKSYGHEMDFDSSGDNYGFEFRWYPAGENGSFSLGLSIEKTSMKIRFPRITGQMSLEDTTVQPIKQADFQASASSEFLLKPLSFHLSFRWDILPRSIVHPYVTFGVGIASGTALDEATVNYSYKGDLIETGEDPRHYEDSVTKTLKEIKDEMEEENEDFPLPGFIPYIQLNIGLKGRLARNLHLLMDAGIWDGFMLRGGLSLRF